MRFSDREDMMLMRFLFGGKPEWLCSIPRYVLGVKVFCSLMATIPLSAENWRSLGAGTSNEASMRYANIRSESEIAFRSSGS